jgi:very-short-patch-repair endonuclease
VVEVDGSQHLGGEHAQHDNDRDEELTSLGLTVLRFSSRDVLKEQEAVIETSKGPFSNGSMKKSPLAPLCKRGESGNNEETRGAR